MRFLIIGGDAAGMSAASRAKRRNPKMEVTVLEQTSDVSYSACGMPYNLADPERVMDELIVRSANVFIEKQGIDLRIGHRAERIDRGNKSVLGKRVDGKTFELPYDRLLIATGASPKRLGIPGEDIPGVMFLKLLEDGRRIKSYILENKVKKAIIIGMGYIALEVCEALSRLGIEVDMVKPRPIFLPWMNQELSSVVKDEVEKNGINLHMGLQIKGIERNQDKLRVYCDDTVFDTEMVLIAVGITPNSQIAEDAGLELGPQKAIAVDRQLKTSDPEIFSAGDCADAFHVVSGKKVWNPLALRANRAGWAVADNVLGSKVELEGVAGTAVFKVFDLQIARTGLNPREAKESGFDPVEIVIKSRSRAHAHPGSTTIHVSMTGDKSTGRLLGAQMVGSEGVAHRINAVAVALHAKMSVEDFYQCDLAYAPPFGPVWDPLLTAANQLRKRL